MQSFEWKAISKFGNPEIPYEEYLVVVFRKDPFGTGSSYYIDTAIYNPGYGNVGNDWVLLMVDGITDVFREVTHWANIPPLPKNLPLL